MFPLFSRQDLFTSWERSLQSFKVEPSISQAAFRELMLAYSSPDRYYHTLQHLQRVLSTIETLQDQAQDLASIQLAAWFHDGIYDTHASDNEEKSAALAIHWLTLGKIPSTTIVTVTRLILSTKDHRTDLDDRDGQILLDADLEILGAESADYGNYAAQIRQEYHWVPEAQYLEGRRQVLERFLQRDRLYFTDQMADKLEFSARRNLVAEIQELHDRPSGQHFPISQTR